MAANGTQIKQDIDDSLSNKGYRGVRVFNVITALKAVVDWVTGAVNGNLSTWLRTSDNQPGGANGDGVYRSGNTEFRGGAITITRTPDNKPLAQLPVGTQYGLMVQGNNGGPAFIEFHLPNLLIHQFGVDSDGLLKLHPNGATQSFEVVTSGNSARIATNNALANRKLVLIEVANNDNQFFGFGVLAGQLRHQIGGINDAHVFVAGSSPATSVELMRVAGNGHVTIGDTTSNFRLSVVQNNPDNGVLVVVSNNRSSAGRTGAKVLFNLSSLAAWRIGMPGDADAFVIEGYGAGAYPEYLHIDSAGNVGLSTASPTSRMHVNGTAGHNQLRLEKSFTPVNSGDGNGQGGQVAWDDNYFYVKTSAGWKRAALGTF